MYGGPWLFAKSLLVLSMAAAIPIAFSWSHSVSTPFAWLAVLALLGWILSAFKERRRRVDVAGVLAALAFLLACAFLSLSHGLPTPTGLGVYGGKAKLLWLSCGVPDGSLANPAFETMQNSYPPLCPLLLWLVNALSGGIAERWVVLLPALFAAIAVGALCGMARKSFRGAGPLLFSAIAATPLPLLASSFYSEPPMLCFFIAGLAIASRGDSVRGFAIVGMCGLVKNEGFVLAVLAWIAVLAFGAKTRRTLDSLAALAACVAPGAAWFALSRLCGATLYDYANPLSPDFGKFLLALREICAVAFLRPWRGAFAYPVLFALATATAFQRVRAWMGGRATRSVRMAAAFLAMSALAFAYALSLSLASDFPWHLLCVERILLVPALVALWMVADAMGYVGGRDELYS